MFHQCECFSILLNSTDVNSGQTCLLCATVCNPLFSLSSYSFHCSPFPPLLCHLFVVLHFKPFCHLGQRYVLASSSLCDSSSFLWWKSAGHVRDDWQAVFSSSTIFQADSVWFMCPSSCLPEGHRARDKRCKQSSISFSSLSCVDVFITLLSDLCLLLCLSLCCASSVGLALSVFLLLSVIQPPSISRSAVFSPLSSPIMTFISLLSLLPPLLWVSELVTGSFHGAENDGCVLENYVGQWIYLIQSQPVHLIV